MRIQPLSLDKIKEMAAEMEFVSFDTLQVRDYQLKSHWYRQEHMDLYFYEDTRGKVVKFHMSMFGQILEWTPSAGFRTGMMVEEEQGSAVVELIQYDLQATFATLEQGLLILENALAVEGSVRSWILERLHQQLRAPKKDAAAKSGWRKLFSKFFRF